MRLTAGWATDVGRVRSGNEDSLLVDEQLGVFAVADGMGGHRGGEVASSTAIEAVRVAVANGRAIDVAIREANTAIRERAFGDPDVAGMGTTFTAIVPLDDANLLVGHVGDSRAYLLREGELRKITRDHSLVEDLVREGRITAEQAEIHPQRSIITRALGIEPEIEVDLLTLAVRDGDRILVCSDGLTDMISEREVQRLGGGDDPEAVCQALVDAANAAGGNDNITVVVIDVDDVGDDAAPGAFVDHLAGPVDVVAPPTLDLAPEELVPTPRPRRRPIRTLLRVLAAVVPVVLVLAIGYAVVERRARHTYYVTDQGGEVVVMRGVPGGLWWFDPEVAERTGLKTGTLTEGDRALVRATFCERGSLAAALECVADLEARRIPTTGIDETTTTPTTAAPTTPTTSRATTTTRPSPSTTIRSRA